MSRGQNTSNAVMGQLEANFQGFTDRHDSLDFQLLTVIEVLHQKRRQIGYYRHIEWIYPSLAKDGRRQCLRIAQSNGSFVCLCLFMFIQSSRGAKSKQSIDVRESWRRV